MQGVGGGIHAGPRGIFVRALGLDQLVYEEDLDRISTESIAATNAVHRGALRKIIWMNSVLCSAWS